MFNWSTVETIPGSNVPKFVNHHSRFLELGSKNGESNYCRNPNPCITLPLNQTFIINNKTNFNLGVLVWRTSCQGKAC